MAGLTPTGFEIKTLEQVESEMDDTLHSTISPQLNLTSTSAYGQLKSVTASHTSELWDAALALYMSWDADSATGAALDRLGALTGTLRRPATASTAVLTLSLLAGTYAPGELVVSKVGDGTVRFENQDEIVLASDDTSYQAQFVSQETGPVTALAHELSVIEPVDGFVSADNANAAIVGKTVENDTDYRRRRALERALKGSTTVDAIRADMLQVLGVDGDPLFEFVSVVENDTDNYVDGRPPHSFETLLIGGTDQEIWDNLLLLKPAGIRAYGTTTGTASDTQGNAHSIGFTRPTEVEIVLGYEIDVIDSLFPGLSAVYQAVTDYFLVEQSVGYDVVMAAIINVIMDVPGVINVKVRIGTNVNPVVNPFADFEIDAREIGVLSNQLAYAVGHYTGKP